MGLVVQNENEHCKLVLIKLKRHPLRSELDNRFAYACLVLELGKRTLAATISFAVEDG